MRNSEVRVSHLFVKRDAKLVKYGDKTKTENENETNRIMRKKEKGKIIRGQKRDGRWKMETGRVSNGAKSKMFYFIFFFLFLFDIFFFIFFSSSLLLTRRK